MTARQRRRLADQVRRAISGSELSQYAIAKRSGVDKSTLSRFMNGKSGLSFESIELLAPVLGLQITTKKR